MFKRKKAKEAADGLRDVAFFDGFTEHDLVRVATLADEIEAEQGAELTDQGRPGLECYVILDGRASVLFAGEHVATLEKGSMVGEMALIDHRPRSATVVAETPMTLLAFDTNAFSKMLDEMPAARQKVMAILNDRLRDNRERNEP
jgi:CRP/FNR family cyclic AMP-dependent transcriptional regulator